MTSTLQAAEPQTFNLEEVWLTDRSRYEEDLKKCPRRRYLKYHAITGYGIEPLSHSMPLITGIEVHSALAGILGWCQENGHTKPSPPVVRACIAEALQDYRKEIIEGGFTEVDGDQLYTLEEQCALVEGLVWGWVRAQLPNFLRDFEILWVEEEAPLDLGDGIVLQTRSDAIARRRSDGKVVVIDFKTSKYQIKSEDDNWVEDFQHDPQMVGQMAGAEKLLGHTIDQFYVHALLKGGRGKFKKKGKEPTQTRQYSDLIYAKVIPSCPPFQSLQIDPSGYWWDKAPLWTADLGQPEGTSPVEHWVRELMPLPMLQEQFVQVGPYSKDEYLAGAYLRELKWKELEWIQRLWELHQGQPRFGDPQFQILLEKLVPRSWDCRAGGELCPFYDICLARPGWEDPLGSGRFRPRRAHHEMERRQMEIRLEVSI